MVATRTLAEIFGVDTEERLQYHALAKGGEPVELPMLGLPRRREPEPATAGPRERSRALRQSLLEAFREITGWADAEFDADDDIPMRAFGQLVYLRVVEAGPWVRFWAPLLRDVDETPELLLRLNALNASGGMRLRVHHGAVYAEHDLAAEPMVAAVLSQTPVQFSKAVCGLDVLLHNEFGGQLTMNRPDITGAVQ